MEHVSFIPRRYAPAIPNAAVQMVAFPTLMAPGGFCDQLPRPYLVAASETLPHVSGN